MRPDDTDEFTVDVDTFNTQPASPLDLDPAELVVDPIPAALVPGRWSLGLLGVLVACASSTPAALTQPDPDAPAWAVQACGVQPIMCGAGATCCPQSTTCGGAFPAVGCPAGECCPIGESGFDAQRRTAQRAKP